jgi:hypothetical protein
MNSKQRRQERRRPLQEPAPSNESCGRVELKPEQVPVDAAWEAFVTKRDDRPVVYLFGQFCEESGCPPDYLEEWLRTEWNAHNIQRVERLEEEAGPFPLILIKQAGPFYTLRLYSPKLEVFDQLPAAPKKWVQ